MAIRACSGSQGWLACGFLQEASYTLLKTRSVYACSHRQYPRLAWVALILHARLSSLLNLSLNWCYFSIQFHSNKAVESRLQRMHRTILAALSAMHDRISYVHDFRKLWKINCELVLSSDILFFSVCCLCFTSLDFCAAAAVQERPTLGRNIDVKDMRWLAFFARRNEAKLRQER